MHGLFFVSGAAGLIYEVIWIRQLGNVLGNTVYSASLVTAVFMGGLGLGSFFAGGWADRRARVSAAAPLLAYGWAELAVAGMAVVLAMALPALAPLSARITPYVADPGGFFEPSRLAFAARFGIAVVLLSPPTFLMGATFTLLVRHLLSENTARAGLEIGALYAANSAGAALGALLTDGALVPHLGLLRTQLLTAAAQAAVGGVSIALARRAPSAAALPPAAAPEARVPPRVLGACVALFLSGFGALGMEIVWFRALTVALGSYRAVYSIVLALLLAGLWLGSVLGGAIHHRFGRPAAWFALAQGLLVLTALFLAAAYTRPTTLIDAGVGFSSAARLLFVPSVLMGASIPLANAVVQDAVGEVGRRAGALYLANTAGAVAGSLVTGLVLLPALGVQRGLAVVGVAAALAPFALLSSRERARPVSWAPWAVGLASAVLALAAFSALPDTFLLARLAPRLRPDERLLAVREGASEVVEVTERADGGRALVTNGHPMSATLFESQRYMRAFSHLPLLMLDDPKTALVICFGVGATLHAASLHASLERIEIADLSENVLSNAPFFREQANHDVLHDPRVRVFVNDGRQHLWTRPEARYDLITLEPPPIAFAGVSALYTKEFYALARSRLRQGGLLSQWLPAYQAPADVDLSLVRAFLDVFPDAVLLSGQGSELILVGGKERRPTLDLDAVERKLAAEPRVAADLTAMRAGTLTELVGMFVADADALKAATREADALTDDRPVLEYSLGAAWSVPPSLFHLDGVARYCPSCFVGAALDPRVSWLPAYQEALGRLYASTDFLTSQPRLQIDRRSGRVPEAIERSAYLRYTFGVKAGPQGIVALREAVALHPGDADAHFALAYALASEGQPGEAILEQRRGLELAPGSTEGHYNLAALYASFDHLDDAAAEAEKALALTPDHARSNALLCRVLGPEDPTGARACAAGHRAP